MWHCDLTLDTPAENLACDEALLDLCESTAAYQGLRFWQSTEHFAVVGYANHVAREVDLAYCLRSGIPVFRRCSGGGAVLQGPGCLSYSLILRVETEGRLAGIASTNKFIMGRHQAALAKLLQSVVEQKGHTDLTIGGLKFSGNAQRRRSRSLLFHGSFLLDFDIALIERALPMPSHQPDYRKHRSHTQFLVNLKLSADQLKAELISAWDAGQSPPRIPRKEIEALVAKKYSQPDWNMKF